ncbi:hypothetical protein B0J12DRAFT_639363, partial [Macrophomina phaseolina]
NDFDVRTNRCRIVSIFLLHSHMPLLCCCSFFPCPPDCCDPHFLRRWLGPFLLSHLSLLLISNRRRRRRRSSVTADRWKGSAPGAGGGCAVFSARRPLWPV